MHKLLVAISHLVQGQRLSITVDQEGRYIFKLETMFGEEAKPFWVIHPVTMEKIKFHFEDDSLGEEVAFLIETLIQNMDDAVIHNEPETY